MAVHVDVEEEKIENFSASAKTTLSQQLSTYAEYIIREANLVEEGNREDGASREITSSILLQAVRKYKSTPQKKRSKVLIGLKIVSSFSLLVTGFLFDSDGYKDNTTKLVLFIITLIVACVSTVLQFVKEE